MTPFYQDEFVTLYVGDVRAVIAELPEGVAQTCVTSPPYFGLRDYGTADWEIPADFSPQRRRDAEKCDHIEQSVRIRRNLAEAANKADGGNRSQANRSDDEAIHISYRSECGKCGARRIDSQIGLEASPDDFTAAMVAVFDGVKRVLKDDSTVWLNLGDSYFGDSPTRTKSSEAFSETWDPSQTASRGGKRRSAARQGSYKPKDLMLIPFKTAMALQAAGWWIRQWFPYVKSSAMPESATDRAGNALEVFFHLAASGRYFYDAEAVRKSGSPASVAQYKTDYDGGNHKQYSDNGVQTPGDIKSRIVAKNRDRSLPTNRNGITGSLDNWGKHKNLQEKGQTVHSMHVKRANGEPEPASGTRNFRNSDLWFESVRKPHGIVGDGDDFLGTNTNPKGFSGEFCTACERYYHDARDKKEIKTVTSDEGQVTRECVCGRSDAWLSHFATFPQHLIEPFIKAGTSEAGECSACGKAWVREVEKGEPTVCRNGSQWKAKQMIAEYRGEKSIDTSMHATNQVNNYITLGFFPQCDCDAPARPQTVFEPFSGAGTTFISATKLGRRCIAVELNEDYAKMSIARYKREMAMPVDPPRREEPLPLFAQTAISQTATEQENEQRNQM